MLGLRTFFGLLKPPKYIKLDILWNSDIITHDFFPYTNRKDMLKRVDTILADNPNQIKEIIIRKIKDDAWT